VIHAALVVGAGLLVANHARTGPASLLSRLFKRLWDSGKVQEDTPASQRKKVLAAAEARKKKEVLLLCSCVVVTMLFCMDAMPGSNQACATFGICSGACCQD
jgi:hypothetical protein